MIDILQPLAFFQYLVYPYPNGHRPWSHGPMVLHDVQRCSALVVEVFGVRALFQQHPQGLVVACGESGESAKMLI